MVIDSHVHFWKYNEIRDAWITSDMKILKQDYLPDHLATTLERNEVDGCVAVQADQSEVETRFLSELANTHPMIKGVVGWVDLRSEDIAERLSHLIPSLFFFLPGQPVAGIFQEDFSIEHSCQIITLRASHFQITSGLSQMLQKRNQGKDKNPRHATPSTWPL